jgi:hypothetical protein
MSARRGLADALLLAAAFVALATMRANTPNYTRADFGGAVEQPVVGDEAGQRERERRRPVPPPESGGELQGSEDGSVHPASRLVRTRQACAVRRAA